MELQDAYQARTQMEGDLESARTAVEQYRHQVVETSQLEGEVSCLKMALLEKESLVK